MTRITGDRVRLARELRGLGQAQLGERIGVDQSTLSRIERGESTIASETLDQLMLATQLPAAFFRIDTEHCFPLGSLLFRSQSKLTAGNLDQVRAWADVAFYAASVLSARLKPYSVELPHLVDEAPEAAAELTRSELGLHPTEPIENLIQAVERARVMVLSIPVAVDGLDAFSANVGPRRQPVIVIGVQPKGDRQRFTVAHELGHLVIHSRVTAPTRQLEAEAHRFAAELLLPAVAMREEITVPFSLSDAARMKRRRRVSMQAIIRRARDLGIISENQYRYLVKQISARGWRQEEPAELRVEPEQPRAFRQMAEMIFDRPIDTQAMAKGISLLPVDVVGLLSAYAGQVGISVRDQQQLAPTREPGSVLPFPQRLGERKTR